MSKFLVFKFYLCIALLPFIILTLAGVCDAKLDMEGAIAMWLLDEGHGDTRSLTRLTTDMMEDLWEVS